MHGDLELNNTAPPRGHQGGYDRLTLQPDEIFWRDHQEWLAKQGYMLRPRYRPGWIPSWKDTGMHWALFEDAMTLNHPAIIDATRNSDGKTVVLKLFSRRLDPYEKEITMFLASEPVKSHPRNHFVPIYEVLDLPGEEHSIFVMPVLRSFDEPRFETVGEALECFRQVLEGLQLLHQSRIAHRDLMYQNIMMDPSGMWPELYHVMMPTRSPSFANRAKKPYTRTAKSPKYYIIDFGFSRRYPRDDLHPQATTADGGDRTVPEFQNGSIPHDPFAVDIYCIGNVIQEFILDAYTGFDFLKPLVDAMREPDPKKRLRIGEVVERYDEILRSRRWWQLRARVVSNEEDNSERLANHVRWFFHTVGHILTFKSALPRPRK